jgi:hypothetical protein
MQNSHQKEQSNSSHRSVEKDNELQCHNCLGVKPIDAFDLDNHPSEAVCNECRAKKTKRQFKPTFKR